MQGWSEQDLAYQRLVSRVSSAPSDGRGWYELGCLLHKMRRWGAAAGCFARCGEIWGEDARCLTNLGWNLHLSGREEEAFAVLSRAVELAPGGALGWVNLSVVAGVLGRGGDAVIHARRAVELEPSGAVNRVALAFALMAEGEWAEGLREYEHRFSYKIPEFLTRPYPMWRGERVGHLYLEGEQGLGDSLMMLRYVGRAAELAERVTLYVHGPVYPVLERCGFSGNVRAMPLPQPLPGEVDAWCPLFSLPIALGVEGPDGGDGYIARRAVGQWSKDFDIGICWGGSAEHEQAHHRDAPLVYFLRLAEVPSVRLHSLQVGDAAGQMSDLAAYGLIRDRAPEITNFGDTARVVEGLDLVITVDTAVAHLAGAMGVPTWLLVNTRGQDFRWGRSGETTDWYSSMRLFRRGLHEDWAAMMDRVREALRERIGIAGHSGGGEAGRSDLLPATRRSAAAD